MDAFLIILRSDIVAVVLLACVTFFYTFFGTTENSVKNDGKQVGVVESLYIYPIKGCSGIKLEESVISKLGFLYDRNWLIITKKDNRFISQRGYPKMALIKLQIVENNLVFNAPDMTTIKIPLIGLIHDKSRLIEVGVWEDNVMAYDEGDEIAKWLSDFLRMELRLVRFAGVRLCFKHQEFSAPESDNIISFTDGYSFLLASLEGLQEVNDLVPNGNFDIRRFRPNILISGSKEQTSWWKLRIGDGIFYNVKPCDRCKVTTVDPDKGEVSEIQPLTVIQEKLKSRFGINLQHTVETRGSVVKVGMPVYVLETKDPY